MFHYVCSFEVLLQNGFMIDTTSLKKEDFFTASGFRQDRSGSDKQTDLVFPLLFVLSPVIRRDSGNGKGVKCSR